MSDDIKLSLEVDTNGAVDDLDKVGDASRTAGEALDALDKKAAGVDTSITVDIDVDQAKARAAGDAFDDIDRKGRGMADGIGFGNNALRDLTGPLGDSIGPAGDLGDAFEGLGDIAAGLGTKLGLGEEAASKLAGAVAGVGVVVAAGVAAWNLYKTAQEKARKEAENLLEIQQKIADGKFADAASDLAKDYGGTLRALERFGLGSEDLVRTLNGQTGPLDALKQRYKDLGAELETVTGLGVTGGAGNERVRALETERAALDTLIANLGGYRTAWEQSGEDIIANQRYADELTVAIGGSREEAEATRDAVRDIKGAFDDLTKALDDQTAIENVRDAFDDVQDAAQEAWDKAAAGAPDADRAMRDYEQTVRDAIAVVLGLNEELEGIPNETVAAIAVKVNDGDLAGARALLEDVSKDLPPVKIGIDQDFLSQQFADWLRRSGPGSSNMNPAPAPGAGTRGGGTPNPRLSVVNYYNRPMSGVELYRQQRDAYRVQRLG
jgi:hypothetical protein